LHKKQRKTYLTLGGLILAAVKEGIIEENEIKKNPAARGRENNVRLSSHGWKEKKKMDTAGRLRIPKRVLQMGRKGEKKELTGLVSKRSPGVGATPVIGANLEVGRGVLGCSNFRETVPIRCQGNGEGIIGPSKKEKAKEAAG